MYILNNSHETRFERVTSGLDPDLISIKVGLEKLSELQQSLHLPFTGESFGFYLI